MDAQLRNRKMGSPDAYQYTEEMTEDLGKTIKGENLFGTGTELATWVSMLVQHSGLKDPSKRDIQSMVAAHWNRGITLMWEEWKGVGNDFDKFLLHIMERAGLRADGPEDVIDSGEGVSRLRRLVPVDLQIGNPGLDLATQEPVRWRMNAKGVSPHIGIMGTLGTGKTALAKQFLLAMHESMPDVKFLIFDMGKGDLAADSELVSRLGASIINSPHSPVPLDVLFTPDRIDTTILDAARRFRDSFQKASVSRLGAKQIDALREAGVRALRRTSPVTMVEVRNALREYYDELKRGDDIVISTFNELCDYRLFQPTFSPQEFFKRNWVLDVHTADEMTQRLVVYLVLDAVDTYLARLKDSALDDEANRQIRLVVVVDEARKVLGSGQPSLINIVRTSRSKGGAVVFITQSPDDFGQEDENFMENLGLTLSFRTNARSSALRAVFGENVDLAGLQNGVCVTRIPEKRGVLRIKAWDPQQSK